MSADADGALGQLADRLAEVRRSYTELTDALVDPEVLGDSARYTRTAKRQAELAEVVQVADRHVAALDDAEAAHELAKEAQGDDRDLFRAEAAEAEARAGELVDRLQVLLIPKDPLDEKNVMVEIRAGAGGDEAGLFAGDLYRMYSQYAEACGWKVEEISASSQGIGGVKEVIFEVNGHGAYSRLKHESGVHRVQRVPETESGGRIHTSTVSVAVMPEAEEIDVHIDQNDLKVDYYRSSGPGGQSVNTTDSAVRITHEPTGTVVAMQDEKSQLQNREKAMRVLRARLLQAEQERQAAERADARAAQIGTGDRSEKIRTYNFPQNRVTDHRIGYTSHDLPDVIGGKLHGVIEALTTEEQRRRLAALTTETV